jgi:hypothetical protein
MERENGRSELLNATLVFIDAILCLAATGAWNMASLPSSPWSQRLMVLVAAAFRRPRCFIVSLVVFLSSSRQQYIVDIAAFRCGRLDVPLQKEWPLVQQVYWDTRGSESCN